MNYKVLTIEPFDKQLKRLLKKYTSIKKDFSNLVDSLEKNPLQGTSLGNNCYKIRMAIKSKAKGKSGGARVIINLHIEKTTVYLLAIYDKSEQETITDKELIDLVSLIKK